MTKRTFGLTGLLVVVLLLAAACSGGSKTTTSTTTTKPKTSTTARDTGSSVSSDTGSSSGAYCAAARKYDSDLANFDASNSSELSLAIKDVTELHSKAPKEIKSAYAVVLSTLQEVEESGTGAPSSDELSSYNAAFKKVIDYDHAHCGLPAY